jgi:hypothetical protein
MELWLVAQNKEELPQGVIYEIQGVFDSEEKAVAACLNEKYWTGRLALNHSYADATVEWDIAYFPKQKGVSA